MTPWVLTSDKEIAGGKTVRLALIGFGAVGQWLAKAIDERRKFLADEFGFAPLIVSVATARNGFLHNENGLDISALLDLANSGRSLSGYPHAKQWETAREGLRATDFDVLVECTGVPLEEAAVGIEHMRIALRRGRSVITSSKWPVALAAADLIELATSEGAHFRCESTVMSGTPVLSTIREGIAGTRIRAIKAVLNGTANFILCEMESGCTYDEALREAQIRGYAENNPADDVDGSDSVAKILILAALAFGVTVEPGQVLKRGIGNVTAEDIVTASSQDKRIKHVASLHLDDHGALRAWVEPVAIPLSDPLALMEGVNCGISIDADPIGTITIMGPGAGKELAGQGVFADLIAVGREFT